MENGAVQKDTLDWAGVLERRDVHLLFEERLRLGRYHLHDVVHHLWGVR